MRRPNYVPMKGIITTDCIPNSYNSGDLKFTIKMIGNYQIGN